MSLRVGLQLTENEEDCKPDYVVGSAQHTRIAYLDPV